MVLRLFSREWWRSRIRRLVEYGFGLVGAVGEAPPSQSPSSVVQALPPTCLRAIRYSKWLLDGGTRIDTDAFVPDMTTSARRDDGGYETSIDWEDNASVLTRTRQQPNATYGVARLALAVIVHMQN